MFDSYITKTWYRDTYPSVNKFTSDDAGLDNAIFEASRTIDRLTFQRATLFDDMTDDEQDCIKYAVAAQVDYLAGLGYDPEDMSSSESSGGFALGKYSETAKSGDTRVDDKISAKAMRYLRVCNLSKNGFKDQNNPYRHTFGDSLDVDGDYDA